MFHVEQFAMRFSPRTVMYGGCYVGDIVMASVSYMVLRKASYMSVNGGINPVQW